MIHPAICKVTKPAESAFAAFFKKIMLDFLKGLVYNNKAELNISSSGRGEVA